MKASLYNEVLVRQSLTQATRSANTAVNGTTVDRAQYLNHCRSAMVVVQTGAVTDGSHAVILEESDNGSDWSTATDLQGSAPTLTSSDDNVIKEFGYTGSKRYLRVTVTTSGATSGGVFGAVILLGFPRRKPIARA